MKCSLCQIDAKQFAKAHIIPKSLYGATITKEADTLIVSSNKNTRVKRFPIGEYDSELLCRDCEAQFAPLDEKAALLLVNETPTIFYHDNEPLYATYQSIDSKAAMAFFQFLMWRIGASSRPMFSRISLGTYQEALRKAVLSGDSSICPELDVVISKFDRDTHAILSPSKLRIQGVNSFRVVFAGHTCWIKLDQRPFPEDFREVALSSGKVIRAMCQEFKNSPEFRAMKEMIKGDNRLKEQNFKGWRKVNAR